MFVSITAILCRSIIDRRRTKMLSLPKQRWPVWCVRMLRVPCSFTRFLARNGSYVGRKTGRRPDERKQRGARVSLAALSSLPPHPPGSLVAPRYVAKEGGGVGGCNGHVGAFLRASLLVRCSVLTIQSRTAERARSPLHSALHSVFAAPRSGFVRNCMRRGGHASWASQSEASRRGLGGNCYERQLPTD